MMQQDRLDGQIGLESDELASNIAFLHDGEERKLFSEGDIPEDIREIMESYRGG